MKLLVTGICGFIGSHFAEHALVAGHEVIGLDCLSYSGRSKNLPIHAAANVFRHDINDAEAVAWILREHTLDALVHFAAETHVARSIDSREEFLRTNVLGTNVLLEESLKYWREHQDFCFLHVSTDEVYGSLGFDDPAWTEESPYAPNNPYSASKAAADHLVRSYSRTYGLPTIITHSANNYGTRQHPEKLIPTLIRQLLRGEPMTLHGNGKNVRDWMHVDDHCRGILYALTHGMRSGVYNFGGLCERSNKQIAELIAATTGKRADIIYVPNRPGNDLRYATNIKRASDCLGWVPGEKIEERITDVVQWYIDNPNYEADYGE